MPNDMERNLMNACSSGRAWVSHAGSDLDRRETGST